MDAILNIDLRGTVLGSSIAVKLMEKQPSGGWVYNLEGLVIRKTVSLYRTVSVFQHAQLRMNIKNTSS